ncbi:MAG TPA: hydroxylamine reductase, partial [Thermoplasmata archaeon]|nr:hydroxylamine reductase [Thermoplasmata archaeon]
MSMFCFQCQEAARNKGCTTAGICGKDKDVSILQDVLIYLLKGISIYGEMAKELGVRDREVERFVLKALFTTITNV